MGSGDSQKQLHYEGPCASGWRVSQHVFCSLVSHPSFLAPPLCFPLEREMIFPSLPLLHGHAFLEGRGQRCILNSWNPKLQIPQALCPPVKTSIVCECHPAAHSWPCLLVSFHSVCCVAVCSCRADAQWLFYQLQLLIQAVEVEMKGLFWGSLSLMLLGFWKRVWTRFREFLPAVITSFI